MKTQKKAANAKSLTPLALELIASRFRALSEPVRLRLLNLLMHKEQSVGELVAASGSGQANVSKHLAILKEAGMVGTRKEGQPPELRLPADDDWRDLEDDDWNEEAG
jgi:DNA-binding transcriptional ArsR family regulator